jgi:ribosomal protein S12 methylthiotransferase accessory factor
MAPDLLLMRFWPLFGTLLMEIKVNFLDKLRLEAKFDDFTVIADQPIRYKGDGSAPGPRLLSGFIGIVRGVLREVVLQYARYSY